ncbi:zinc ribbon-containing protein [Clostridium sp. FP1]|uniref:zinc ribbon-containing protein n=1 Tax=Clostridium sp. FP1 TaxID=2724076 RepID=UPI0013E936EF|nr:zinc ribbon-containing protein [Clostridium sp. FP1]MBZ9633054.1 zinc ribbon-containing protein [Clostridium sp. FP1]
MDYCIGCSNTGRYQQPNDEAEFDRLFDYYDRPGTLSMDQCYDKAIDKVGYTVITPCPHCNRGTK